MRRRARRAQRHEPEADSLPESDADVELETRVRVRAVGAPLADVRRERRRAAGRQDPALGHRTSAAHTRPATPL